MKSVAPSSTQHHKNEPAADNIVVDTLNTMTVEVMRYRPSVDEAPWWQAFKVEWSADMSILDALLYIKDTQAPDLSFRWSCRMEVCGSCGMVVNGVPKLACSTFVRDYANARVAESENEARIRIGALDQMPIEKDLVIDIHPFVEKLASIKPYIIDAAANPVTHTEPPTQVQQQQHTQTPKQLAKFKQYSMCINCLLCYQACPQVGINAAFLALRHRHWRIVTIWTVETMEQKHALRS